MSVAYGLSRLGSTQIVRFSVSARRRVNEPDDVSPDREMQKFQDVLSRWESGELSMMEAGELLGLSSSAVPTLSGPI